MLTDNDKHSSDMKNDRIEILQKVAKGELTPEQAYTQQLGLFIVVAMLPNDDKRKELTEIFYWLNLQNLSGREEFDEAFRLGIMTGIDELTEWLQEGN